MGYTFNNLSIQNVMVEEDPKTGKVLVALTDFEYCQKMCPQAD